MTKSCTLERITLNRKLNAFNLSLPIQEHLKPAGATIGIKLLTDKLLTDIYGRSFEGFQIKLYFQINFQIF